jgi:hypothetical protein
VKRQIQLQKLFLLLIACSLKLAASSQYWQQKADYTIDVTLNDKEKTLDAFEKIIYTNQSPDTLYFIWFHLWPNAYKNDKTAFSDQALELGETDFYFSGKEEKGYINHLDFKVDGVTAKTEDHPQHIDIIKLVLPKPLLPGQQITIATPFHEKLPFNFSRGGYDGRSFQITQWYPKPAVYDKNGWHPMPYLDQGEFYSEFGSFDVRITVPKNYIVAATGELQTEEEKQWLEKRELSNSEVVKPKRANTQHVTTRTNKTRTTKKPTAEQPLATTEFKTIRYKQDSVHDFAWFADTGFIVKKDTCQLASGKIIQVQSFYTRAGESIWKNSVEYAKDALRFYSNEIGEYPYNVASVVQGPQSFGGGMEYPTITLIAPVASSKRLDDVIAHELGHNWFYGILASNERDHPWMDEGINSFYEYKYMEAKYGMTKAMELLFQTIAVRKKDQPIETPSEQLNEINYGVVAYYKTAEWMRLLESEMGKQAFKTQMHNYFEQWKFKHPQPENFKASFQPVLGSQADSIFSLLTTKGIFASNKLSGFKVVTPFSIKDYLQHPAKNILLLSPAAGVNSYDGFMIGGLISTYNLPPNKFQLLAIPMYGTGSKKLTGLARMNYKMTSDGGSQTDIFLNASQFSMDEFTDTAGRKLIMKFQKLVPGIKFTFRQKDPKSTINKFIQWKTFLFNEQSLRVIPDTAIVGTDTSLFLRYLLPRANRYLNQLQFVYENYRSLYPFDVRLQIEQAKDFLRPTITANYFFNYKEGGLQVRLFAGEFIYINGKSLNKQFANDRYFLNMTGPDGYEDYTYSDYFFGRNKFEGFASQQIMIRDGGFKVRTDLLANKIGKTDNWLTAANFSASIPKKYNPLSVLPVKIPLRLFLDVGTYAEAWERDADVDRFLFDAGFQIPLFDGAVNIFMPVVYNKVYSDYFKSTLGKNRFFKTISFSINFYTKSIQEANRITEF